MMNKTDLIEYLKRQSKSPHMIWLYDEEFGIDDGTTWLPNSVINGVELLLNERRLTAKELENLYTLIIPTFPEGLWFLFSVINHPDIDNQIYIKKLKDVNFKLQPGHPENINHEQGGYFELGIYEDVIDKMSEECLEYG